MQLQKVTKPQAVIAVATYEVGICYTYNGKGVTKPQAVIAVATVAHWRQKKGQAVTKPQAVIAVATKW